MRPLVLAGDALRRFLARCNTCGGEIARRARTFPVRDFGRPHRSIQGCCRQNAAATSTDAWSEQTYGRDETRQKTTVLRHWSLQQRLDGKVPPTSTHPCRRPLRTPQRPVCDLPGEPPLPFHLTNNPLGLGPLGSWWQQSLTPVSGGCNASLWRP
jgi:hypothetical protein